jgi:hypothetical protein
MIQEEIRRAGMFAEIAKRRRQSARRAGSNPPASLPGMADLKFEITSGYPQDAECR